MDSHFPAPFHAQRDVNEALRLFALDVLQTMATEGHGAGDRLTFIVQHARTHGLAVANEHASEDTDAWIADPIDRTQRWCLDSIAVRKRPHVYGERKQATLAAPTTASPCSANEPSDADVATDPRA